MVTNHLFCFWMVVVLFVCLTTTATTRTTVWAFCSTKLRTTRQVLTKQQKQQQKNNCGSFSIQQRQQLRHVFVATRTTGAAASVGNIKLSLSYNHNNNDQNNSVGSSNCSDFVSYRLTVAGATISPSGFWIITSLNNPFFKNDSNNNEDDENDDDDNDGEDTLRYFPIQVTSSADDLVAAASAESLTLLQLLAGVDMAGTVLPPNVLPELVTLYTYYYNSLGGSTSENSTTNNNKEEEEEQEQQVELPKALSFWKRFVRVTLPPSVASSYPEANPWLRGRVKFPKLTLEEVKVIPNNDTATFRLGCHISAEDLPFVIPLVGSTANNIGNDGMAIATEKMLHDVCYNYEAETSAAFVSVALALRYKAPLALSLPRGDSSSFMVEDGQQKLIFSMKELLERFPQFRSTKSLRTTSERVVQNIKHGFEYHQLEAALRIAMEKGDEVAAQKIRSEIERLKKDLQQY